VCVRRDPLFKEPEPTTHEPAATERPQRNPSTPTAPAVQPAPEPPGKSPNSKQPEIRNTPNRKQGTFRFRLDA
jgi:hypothetical protein